MVEKELESFLPWSPFLNSSEYFPPTYSFLTSDGSYYERRLLGWNVPPDYMQYVNSHWKIFEAPNPFLHYMLAFLYTIFMACSVIGNGVVIWVFLSSKKLRTPSNLFIINLALLDFLMMVKTPVFIVNSLNQGPIWGKISCDLFALIGSYSGIGGSMTNMAIAYDRFRTITKPFDGKLSHKTALLTILLIWAYASPFSILPLLEIWGRFVPEGFLTVCTFDYLTESTNVRSFVGVIFFFAYVLPGSFIIFFYWKIYGHVKKHEKSMKEQAKKMNVNTLRSCSAEDREKSVEMRIAKVCMGLFFLFMVSWTPYAVVALIGAFGDKSKVTPLVSMIPALTCKMVACIDPWVYAINHPKYRLELQKLMPWFCIHEEETSDKISDKTDTIVDKA